MCRTVVPKLEAGNLERLGEAAAAALFVTRQPWQQSQEAGGRREVRAGAA
jgi:hypothetical protein